MRKLILGIVVSIVFLSIGGTVWNRNCERERGMELYQKKIANQNTQINELEDSINKLNYKLEVYEDLVHWFEMADSEEVERAVHELWNIREEIDLRLK